jgi:hypothetical protein
MCRAPSPISPMNRVIQPKSKQLFRLQKKNCRKGCFLCGPTRQLCERSITWSNSNTEILERFQSKALRMIVDAPWYVSNTVIRKDLQIPTVKEEIRRYSSQYSARLSTHPNDLIVNLVELPDNSRLQRQLPNDLSIRFLA